MRILIDIIPSKHRRIVYALFALAGLVIAILSIVGGFDWISTASEVYNFLGVALGLTAYANTNADTYEAIDLEE